MSKVVCEDYEYAGFHYRMIKEYGIIVAAPHPGQHPAAGKSKHIRTAVELYAKEYWHGGAKVNE